MSKYLNMDIEDLQEHLSNFIIDSWSYSKVNQYSRNQKEFERKYIFREKSRVSASSQAGSAYHNALKYYFNQKKEGKELDMVELEASAFQYIDEIPANAWKIQKTTPTIEDCIAKATKDAVSLIRNFYAEKSVYEDEVAEILEVETWFECFITINGVDIPLPLHGVIDLVLKLKSGKIVIVDHKSKTSFTPDDEIALSIGEQAITYTKGYEAKTGLTVDEVWFIENKISKNKDGGAQLNRFPVVMDRNTRAIYETLLYEPLREMIGAVSDPDHIYLINPSDNYVDRAELYEFWCRTQICEIDEFDVPESKKPMIAERLRKIRNASPEMVPPSVIKKFQENASQFIQYDLSNKNMTQSEKIEHVLRTFNTIVKVAHVFHGFSSNSYLLEVSAGTKISSLYNKRLDIANALDVKNVRILPELKVYEGKAYVCIEVSKKMEETLFFDISLKQGRKIPIGKDNFGDVVYWNTDNPSTPHVLVCGSTGSGKSVFLESTMEFAKEGAFDEIYIFDPKHEFKHLDDQMQFFVYNEIEEIEEQMAGLVKEMNQLVVEGRRKNILIVFDEFADAISQARSGKELDIIEEVQVGNYAPKKGMFGFIEPGAPKMAMKKTGEHKSLEENLRILLQKGRSSGFRIIAALQRASVKVITGDAKVNFPVQICFNVPKAVDSKVVLDEEGAELLGGKGDGLMKSPEYHETIRFQAFYKSPEKVMA